MGVTTGGILEGGDSSPVNATTVAAAGAIMSGTTPATQIPVISRLVDDFTNATTVMAATGLSVPVTAGKKYVFEAVLMINDASGTEGGKFDWDASTATATYLRYYADDGSGGFFAASSFFTTLAADVSGTGFIDDGVVMKGTLEAATSGTFALRAAQSSHAAGSLIIYRGSNLKIWETVA